MTSKALVIRTAGDTAIARQIVYGLESGEVRRLRTENNVLRRRDVLYWAHKRAETARKYAKAIRPHSAVYKAFWGAVGLMLELCREARA